MPDIEIRDGDHISSDLEKSYILRSMISSTCCPSGIFHVLQMKRPALRTSNLPRTTMLKNVSD
jgi:hypothetical protein